MILVRTWAFLFSIVLVLSTSLFAAQTQGPGLTPEWDIRRTLKDLSTQAERLKPLLEQVNPSEWMAQGAPEGYVGQWKAVQAEIGYLVQTVDKLAEKPDRLTVTLEAFFRLAAVEGMLRSLGEGVSKYQNPALADLIQGVASENAANQNRLQRYLVELVAAKEEELRIADQEAQRCRSQLIRSPATTRKPQSQ